MPGNAQPHAVGCLLRHRNAAFGGSFKDTTVWSHELGELIDDPFVQSIPGVPGGITGERRSRLRACVIMVRSALGQNNLEVGDPLSPGEIGNYPDNPIAGVGGFTYHFQDLAFHDWFYRTASGSTGGKYSFTGNFSTVQGPC